MKSNVMCRVIPLSFRMYERVYPIFQSKLYVALIFIKGAPKSAGKFAFFLSVGESRESKFLELCPNIA